MYSVMVGEWESLRLVFVKWVFSSYSPFSFELSTGNQQYLAHLCMPVTSSILNICPWKPFHYSSLAIYCPMVMLHNWCFRIFVWAGYQSMSNLQYDSWVFHHASTIITFIASFFFPLAHESIVLKKVSCKGISAVAEIVLPLNKIKPLLFHLLHVFVAGYLFTSFTWLVAWCIKSHANHPFITFTLFHTCLNLTRDAVTLSPCASFIISAIFPRKWVQVNKNQGMIQLSCYSSSRMIRHMIGSIWPCCSFLWVQHKCELRKHVIVPGWVLHWKQTLLKPLFLLCVSTLARFASSLSVMVLQQFSVVNWDM